MLAIPVWAAPRPSSVLADTTDDVVDAVTASQATGWDIVVAIGVMVVAYPLARLARRWGRRATRKIPNAPEMLILDIGRLAYWTVWLVAAGIALSYLGIGLGWFSIALIAGIALGGLMVKPMIESMAAGLVITMRPSFSIGDKVDIEGLSGTVVEIGTRSTQLKTSTGVSVHIPNTQLLKQTIKVYTSFDKRKASFDVRLARGVDLEAAVSTIVKAVGGAERVVSDPAPSAQATALEANAITVTVAYWYSSSHLSDGSITHESIGRVDTALADADMVLAAPLVEIETVSGTEPTADPADATDDHSDPAGDSTEATADQADPATDKAKPTTS